MLMARQGAQPSGATRHGGVIRRRQVLQLLQSRHLRLPTSGINKPRAPLPTKIAEYNVKSSGKYARNAATEVNLNKAARDRCPLIEETSRLKKMTTGRNNGPPPQLEISKIVFLYSETIVGREVSRPDGG
ncbi:hypothetical protein GWI33_022591 [Rhynchophorus ferrugineus]|uniref:Uncharacterized protein n=1 Tax=Rhynchophorus ferrugineus TaxID=354439 RepID=A0A834HTZ2_RHYFE|nr:hypothetical protein GWI33_022594 [Rhynchophorus ferrugineus]KAF7264703.1 hypothetical protein GWI33_022591 [Rhynchophorus ferrugineus]